MSLCFKAHSKISREGFRCPAFCDVMMWSKYLRMLLDVILTCCISSNPLVITNGFEEIQHVKMTSSNILRYFDHIITSQKAGHRKPSREIFECALKHNDIKCHQAIMIGD